MMWLMASGASMTFWIDKMFHLVLASITQSFAQHSLKGADRGVYCKVLVKGTIVILVDQHLVQDSFARSFQTVLRNQQEIWIPS
jgi:hypothetical protein